YEKGLALSAGNDRAFNGLPHFYGRRDIWGAVPRYSQLQQQAPQQLWTTLALAHPYDGWAQEENALAAPVRANAPPPGDAGLYCGLGVLYENLWNYDQARQMLDVCLDLSPGPPAEPDARAALARILADGRDVHIVSPTAGASLTGPVTILGTAQGPNF